MLGVAHRILGDTRVCIRGPGRARFRLQHAGDVEGRPDELSWCEVSAVSNAALSSPADAVRPDSTVALLLDVVEREAIILYRRHAASWLRVIPHDPEDAEAAEQCAAFTVTMEAFDARDATAAGGVNGNRPYVANGGGIAGQREPERI